MVADSVGALLATAAVTPRVRCVLARVMAQNDFFRGGSLAIPEAEAILPIINTIRKHKFDVVLCSTLERGLNYSGFSSNNPVSHLPAPRLARRACARTVTW